MPCTCSRVWEARQEPPEKVAQESGVSTPPSNHFEFPTATVVATQATPSGNGSGGATAAEGILAEYGVAPESTWMDSLISI